LFVFGIQPLPNSSDAASIVLIASLTISGSDWAFVGFPLSADKQFVALANHGSI
jgi:hypothetical protein